MLGPDKRIQAIEDNLVLKGDYTEELKYLTAVENDLPSYRTLGTPVWKIQEAKENIARIREWINQELEYKIGQFGKYSNI